MDSLLVCELVKCPRCDASVSQQGDNFVCGQGHSFPYRENVIDFSAAQTLDAVQRRSEQSFQTEWTAYYPRLGWSTDELSIEKEQFLGYTRAMSNFFSDKIVIDAGCGNGRYINVLNRISSPRPKLIIGVELSDVILVAANNCASFDNVVFIKIDLNRLHQVLRKPVDYVYSIGVLHHTPNARQSFENLGKCVKKGGFFSVFLYGKGNPVLYAVNSFLRNRFFQKWPHKCVYWLCFLIAIPCQIFRIKLLGSYMADVVQRIIFVSCNVHNMFDAYTAGWTSFHEKTEVEEWYQNIGFDCVVESQLNHTSLYCIGRKITE